MIPTAEPLPIPPEYGRPERVLDWPTVQGLLESAKAFWVATVRPDGRPHIVPKDGLWLDDQLFFGGSPQTVNHRNLSANPEVSVHIGDGATAVMVEGKASVWVPPREQAERLAAEAKRKYGYPVTADTYVQGVWAVKPTRVIAWTAYPSDVTRFTF